MNLQTLPTHRALVCTSTGLMSTTTKRLLIGVMSVLKERDRRDVMRDTWLPEMMQAPFGDATTRFVLGRTNASEADAEQAEHGDLTVLSCEENQHRGKTLLWFVHALRLPEDYAFVAKMDQDVLLWPAQLAHEMASWPISGFYGGWPVDVHRQHWQNDRFAFMNGGLAVLSRDLVESVRDTVQLAAPLQTEEAKASRGPRLPAACDWSRAAPPRRFSGAHSHVYRRIAAYSVQDADVPLHHRTQPP